MYFEQRGAHQISDHYELGQNFETVVTKTRVAELRIWQRKLGGGGRDRTGTEPVSRMTVSLMLQAKKFQLFHLRTRNLVELI